MGRMRVKEAICLSFKQGTKLRNHWASATPCLMDDDVPGSTHQPLRMFAGEHKHGQSRHAAAGGRGSHGEQQHRVEEEGRTDGGGSSGSGSGSSESESRA